MSDVSFRVFSQLPDGRIDVAALVRMATRHFEASLEVLSSEDASSRVAVAITSQRHAFERRFRLQSRGATDEDRAAAVRAEERGRSGGMSSLAARCPFVWVLTSDAPRTDVEPATLNLCAILAAVALGPVLPPDESALFGVRGAMERFEALVAPKA